MSPHPPPRCTALAPRHACPILTRLTPCLCPRAHPAGAPPCPPGLLPPDLLPSLALRGLDANPQAALAALEELELHSLARNLRKMHQDFGGV